MLRIDRRPLPLQVRDRVLAEITAGVLAPGQELFSEQELADRLGVSRATVREGLKLLEHEGRIIGRRGRRHVVSAVTAVERPITQLESVTEMMEALGYSVASRVIGVVTRAPSPEERMALRLADDADVLELRRLRLQDEAPLIVSIDVLPTAIVGEGDDGEWSGSLFDALTARGHVITGAAAHIRATRLPDAFVDMVPGGGSEPWLLLTQVHWNDQGEPILYSHDYHRGEQFRFHVLRQRAHTSSTSNERERAAATT